MRQFNSYFICTSPRSGSTLLCRMLQETKGAGHPDSHFHVPSLATWLKTYGCEGLEFIAKQEALAAAFDAAKHIGRAGTPIFGLRVQRQSFPYLMEQLGAFCPDLSADKARIEAVFGKVLFIHLTRDNKVDQAVSVVKARQTGLWHIAPDGREIERIKEPQEPRYDFEAISAEYAQFVQADLDWNAWFEAERINPLRISYGALSADPFAQLARITGALNLASGSAKNGTLSVAKLSDAVNREWADRFRSEFLT